MVHSYLPPHLAVDFPSGTNGLACCVVSEYLNFSEYREFCKFGGKGFDDVDWGVSAVCIEDLQL